MVTGGIKWPKVVYIRFIGKKSNQPVFLIQNRDGTTEQQLLSMRECRNLYHIADRPDLCYIPAGIWLMPRQQTIHEHLEESFGFDKWSDVDDTRDGQYWF